MLKKGNLCVLFVLAIIFAMVFTACGEAGGGEDEVVILPGGYYIGGPGPGGGIVFYYNEEGFELEGEAGVFHFLEAAPNDFPTKLAWITSGKEEEQLNTEEGIGKGLSNTKIILAHDTNAPAARACFDYLNNGKNDWFLPSRDELAELYKLYEEKGRGSYSNFKDDKYWSSSQAIYQAYVLIAWTGFASNTYESKLFEFYVRPIRAFAN